MINSLKAISDSVDQLLSGWRKERRSGSRSEYLRGRCLVVEFAGGTRTVPIVDAHDGGLAIAGATPLPIGALVTFRGGQDTAAAQLFAKIQGRANVVYCRSYGERRFLMGLQFTEVHFSSRCVGAADLNPGLRAQTS